MKKMHKIKRFLPLLFLPFLLLSTSFRGGNKGGDELLLQLILKGLEYNHFTEASIDDDFSAEVYATYLDRIDGAKRFLLRKDLDILESYKNTIDDEMRSGKYDFFTLSTDLLNKRIEEAKTYYEEILSEPFDFTLKETFETDPDKAGYARDKAELRERWRKSLKYTVMIRLVDKLESQEEALAKEGSEEEQKSFETLESEVRARVLKNHREWFGRLEKLDTEDRLAVYLNAITSIYDPHTSYYPPKDKENFDIRMSGSLEGIGATLQEKDGYVKVVRIVPGSPSWKQGDLKAEDVILKVAQGEEEPVDIVDMPLDDAVQLIRGKKGTEVRLTVKKPEGNIVIVPIIRDVVMLEETYAKSVILKTKDSKEKLGYIKLPKFYADFTGRGGRNSADDVKKELKKLKSEKIEGLILDLRNNGGGSLRDVVEMAGFFIKKGPIVQVKTRYDAPHVLTDRDPSVQYDGPLVILVNSLSASASEILAAAMQDYGRAIVIGSESTFGKGTVQKFFSLDNMINRPVESQKPLGAIKITIQKFYRINGGATQLKGVTPDIILPDNYSHLEIGEREQEHPMKWDEIQPVSYESWNPVLSVHKLASKSKARTSANEVFKKQKEKVAYLKALKEDTDYSLNLEAYRKELAERKSKSKLYEDIFQPIESLEIDPLSADWEVMQSDSIKQESFETWRKGLQKDAYVFEAMQVIQDM